MCSRVAAPRSDSATAIPFRPAVENPSRGNLPHGRWWVTLTGVTNAAYLDSSLPVADRVADLVSRMTLAEKVGQMLQLDAKNGVDEYVLEYDVRSLLHASPESLARPHALVAQTRLPIPLLTGDACIHGHPFFDA